MRAWFPFLIALLTLADAGQAQRFRPDDPLRREPDPLDVRDLQPRRINEWYDYYRNAFQEPGEGNERPGGPYAAQSVNTLGEVMDGAWYQNRTLTHDQIVRGPGDGRNPPDTSAPWRIVSAKTEGVTPGFVILDPKSRRYVLKFDPLDNLEMATAADVISGKLLHALGYHVPENYLVTFQREQLQTDPSTKFTDAFGRRRAMRERDVTEILMRVPRTANGGIRAVASLYVPGTPLGPFKYYGRRKGDKNDFVRHEHRRELRGLHVFSAWRNHHDSRSINTLDTLVEEGGVRFVRHYLIDFGSTLGSAAVKSKSAREGNAPLFSFPQAAVNFVTLGAYTRDWERARYPYYPSLGRIQHDAFEPEEWVPNYPNRAFLNRLPDDTFWAAKTLMRLTDEDIRAVVASGQLSDKEAESWLAECLIERRRRVAKAYLGQGLALDGFAVRDGGLVFEDLAARHGLAQPQTHTIRWESLNNATGARSPLGESSASGVPAPVLSGTPGSYWVAQIRGGQPNRSVLVTLRAAQGGLEVVGVERTW